MLLAEKIFDCFASSFCAFPNLPLNEEKIKAFRRDKAFAITREIYMLKISKFPPSRNNETKSRFVAVKCKFSEMNFDYEILIK